jgi:hypothetical protein
MPDLIFPVYKIDCEQSWKNVSKEHLKIPKRYSEAVVFENCIWIWRIIVSFWYYIHIKTQVNRNFRTSTFLLFLVLRWTLRPAVCKESLIKEKINNSEWINLTHDFVFNFFYYSKLTWYNKENCWTNKSFTCLPLRTDDHILKWSSALDTSVIDNWKINNPTFDVVNDVNQASFRYKKIVIGLHKFFAISR